jgi:hypothetical protein
MDDLARTQLQILQEIGAILSQLHVRFWLRGGWAVDFMLGEVTRPHADIDLVIWRRHQRRAHDALVSAGFSVDRQLETQTDFRKSDQDISFIFLERIPEGRIITHGIPVWTWPAAALPSRRLMLNGLAASVVDPELLLWEKESYEQGTGRPLRPKDVQSIATLRRIIAARSTVGKQDV